MRLLIGHREAVCSVAYYPDGTTLATGGMDRMVRLWDVGTGVEKAILRPHKGTVHALAFSPDGSALAAGGAGRELKIWNLAARRIRHKLVGHISIVKCAVFLSDRLLLSGSGDRSLVANQPGDAFLWDLGARPHPRRKPFGIGAAFGVLAAAYSPAGKCHALGTGLHSIIGYRMGRPGTAFRLKQQANVRGLAFHPDGVRLASIEARKVRVWDTRGRSEVAVLEGHEDIIQGVAFSPDGRTLLTGSWDGTAILWDTTGWKVRAAFDWGVGKVRAVALSPDGMTAAAAGHDGRAVVWDLDEV